MAVTLSCSNMNDFERAARSITSDELRTYTMTLAADSFMGRKPFTKGETVTTTYLASKLKEIGYEPAFDGSYFQKVPVVEISSTVTTPATIEISGKKSVFAFPEEIAIWSDRQQKENKVDKIPMVFCGFGIVAPEYGWDDYKDKDVTGKCVVIMINDPGLYTGDTTLFKGREMTYHGRWTYKLEEAARQGAAAVLIIHETVGAGYDFSIPRKSAITPGLYKELNENDQQPCLIAGWIQADAAQKLFGGLGYNVDSLRKEACQRGYKGFDMKALFTASVSNEMVSNYSYNVGGILKGKSHPEEAIVIEAHWDHFGVGEKVNGDSIFNGAVDNGTAMAWALEIGGAFSSLRRRPERSVILLFPTAEEDGLLGSYYFTSHPPVPAKNIIACFNNDMMLADGRMKDIMITGYGLSDLDDMLAEAVRKQDRYIMPDPTPEKGMYFRSDHFPFARIGVPALFARGNCDSREFGREWAAEKEKEYMNTKYHKQADNYYPEMNFDGIAEDASAIFEVAWRIVSGNYRPSWKPGSEFANAGK